MIIWSSQTIKEPVIIFLETLAVYGCVNIRYKGFSVRHTILTFACIALLYPFRAYATYIITIATFAGLFPRFKPGQFSIGPIVALGLLAGLLTFSGFQAGYEKQTELLDLEYSGNFRRDIADSRSGVKLDVDLNTSTGMGLALLVGAVHLLLAPFPWQLASGSTRMLFSGAGDALLVVALLYGPHPRRDLSRSQPPGRHPTPPRRRDWVRILV